jgi:UDP-N-acetylglucosamine--N-acetylmuramyl-(pentapeptide) pyrophosphoryl-undecaprenol N-acetylglucosamine transferase
MNKKIIFSTGGTGGHILPAIHLMKHFSSIGYEVLLVTDFRGKHFMKSYPEFTTYILNVEVISKKNLLKAMYSLALVFISIIKSIFILKKERPNLVFGLGGYASFPICFSSKFFNLPLLIYENNIVLGVANKYLSKISKKILVAKKIISNPLDKYKDKICEVGTILNKNITNNTLLKKKNNKDIFSILILGGSQGAEIFGTVVPPAIKMLKDNGHKIMVNQQCIPIQKVSIIEFYNKNSIPNHIFEFEKNILDLFLSTDLAITRCGASSTAELVQTLTPFIAIPFPNSIHQHQYLNAKYYKDKGCCLLLEQEKFNTDSLFNLIEEHLKNRKKLDKIQDNMKKKLNTNVYSNIESEIRKLILI